jgi:hypothetical protein
MLNANHRSPISAADRRLLQTFTEALCAVFDGDDHRLGLRCRLDRDWDEGADATTIAYTLGSALGSAPQDLGVLVLNLLDDFREPAPTRASESLGSSGVPSTKAVALCGLRSRGERWPEPLGAAFRAGLRGGFAFLGSQLWTQVECAAMEE